MFLFSLLAFVLFGCDSSDDNTNYATPTTPKLAKQILNVPYGDDPQQVMDVYLPKGRNALLTKVFVVVHGGGWYSGDKADMNFMVVYLKTNFPDYAIVNLNYRLGTLENIGYPRQLQDIQAAIAHLDNHTQEYDLSRQYGMIGFSAGAHLSMLYAYRYNTGGEVKAVCSMVGPSDFSDPSYNEHRALFSSGLPFFVGDDYPDYNSNPLLYNEISPVNYISLFSPKTILFYGIKDDLVPKSQGEIIRSKLNQFLVYNQYHEYDMGHTDCSPQQLEDIQDKMTSFFNLTF